MSSIHWNVVKEKNIPNQLNREKIVPFNKSTKKQGKKRFKKLIRI